MVREFERYHGIALNRLVHGIGTGICIETYPTPSNSSYVVNLSNSRKRVGIYIKYSTSRLSPWKFSFKKEHQEEIKEMQEILGKVAILFVCHEDGIAALSYEELTEILDGEFRGTEYVGIWRNPREKYLVKGTDGKLSKKIGENEFPFKLFS